MHLSSNHSAEEKRAFSSPFCLIWAKEQQANDHKGHPKRTVLQALIFRYETSHMPCNMTPLPCAGTCYCWQHLPQNLASMKQHADKILQPNTRGTLCPILCEPPPSCVASGHMLHQGISYMLHQGISYMLHQGISCKSGVWSQDSQGAPEYQQTVADMTDTANAGSGTVPLVAGQQRQKSDNTGPATMGLILRSRPISKQPCTDTHQPQGRQAPTPPVIENNASVRRLEHNTPAIWQWLTLQQAMAFQGLQDSYKWGYHRPTLDQASQTTLC
jgi:hypothetical protein